MKHFILPAKAAIPAALLLAISPASAAPLTYDCDARVNASSSVSNLAQTSPSLSGTINIKRLREGRLLPTAAANIASPDGKSLIGFQLQAPSPEATELNIVLNRYVGEDRENVRVGTVARDRPVTFRLFLNDQGVAVIFVNDQSWTAPFMRLIGGKEAVSCSTGQFEFSELRFSD